MNFSTLRLNPSCILAFFLLYSHRPDLFGKKRFYTKIGEKQPFLCREKPTFQAEKMTKIFTKARKSVRFSIF
jgi:hypothetical protein